MDQNNGNCVAIYSVFRRLQLTTTRQMSGELVGSGSSDLLCRGLSFTAAISELAARPRSSLAQSGCQAHHSWVDAIDPMRSIPPHSVTFSPAMSGPPPVNVTNDGWRPPGQQHQPGD